MTEQSETTNDASPEMKDWDLTTNEAREKARNLT